MASTNTTTVGVLSMCAWMIDEFGQEAQKAAWIPQLASMEKLSSYCLTEPGSGSDAAALTTTAHRKGDVYVLNGTKVRLGGGGVQSL